MTKYRQGGELHIGQEGCFTDGDKRIVATSKAIERWLADFFLQECRK
jgi:hypothetical protein